VRRSEILLGKQTVVGCAQQSQVAQRFTTASGPGQLVVNLKQRARFAALPIFTDVRAA
jgi:hypothetical protein